MTDEERQKLIMRLRRYSHLGAPPMYAVQAADELERLAAELEATTDAENQMLLEAQMLNHDLGEEIKYQHGEIERLVRENAQMRDMLLQFVAATADRIEAAEKTGTIQ